MTEGAVLDVDVLLGLTVSGGLERIAHATSLYVAVPKQVYLTVCDELKGTAHAKELVAAVDRNVLGCVEIPREALGQFFQIVSMPFAESLDDCATAAMLCATYLGACILASDDDKVRKQCSIRFPELEVVSFAGFFQLSLKSAELDVVEARHLLAAAVDGASMRLRLEDLRWASDFLERDVSSFGTYLRGNS